MSLAHITVLFRLASRRLGLHESFRVWQESFASSVGPPSRTKEPFAKVGQSRGTMRPMERVEGYSDIGSYGKTRR